ncbi:MAG: membrane-associated phospholipid phosphatase [Flavobacteriaceae bacterium]|jgi:membrane-associated phospholipid phosphatase
MKFGSIFLVVFLIQFNCSAQQDSNHSAARLWMDAYLQSIKEDGFGPTIHARNLFHLSMAMYDSWEVYNGGELNTLLLGKTIRDFSCDFDEFDLPENIDSAINVTIHYAAFRLISGRFSEYGSKNRTMDAIIDLFDSTGLNPSYRSTDYSTGSAAALGNYIAEKILIFGLQEPAGDADGYEAVGYNPVNAPMRPEIAGSQRLSDPNRWQPLSILKYINRKGWDKTLKDWNNLLILQADVFLTPHWGQITPFAMGGKDLKIMKREGIGYPVYHDPGPPPFIGKDSVNNEEYMWNFMLVNEWGSHNDPNDATMIDISPAAIGTTNEILPRTFEAYLEFFNFDKGGTKTNQKKINPKTGKKYEKNIVRRGDYTRVIAEYWVDGVNTLSPPGHWMDLFNQVSDDPRFEKKWKGKGKVLSDLEWDVKSYLTMTGGMHDAGISAWGTKAFYDYIRPISALRWMAGNGQSTDTTLSNYHVYGLPLINGVTGVVSKKDALAGKDGENVGKIKMYSWKGPEYIDDVSIDIAGTGWILAENWWPYQRYSFATPPFAGYISGHSTFSTAAAEIITSITGDPYFPGGLKEITFEKDTFLEFENGPSEDITLQWATYREAADETCLSRIWGGIHPPVDDIRGRIVGEKVAIDAFEFANLLFEGKINIE